MDHKKLVDNSCKGTFRSLSAPLPTKDDWNPDPQFFVGTFQKFVQGLQILLASLRKKNPNPLFQNPPSLGGKGRGGEGRSGMWIKMESTRGLKGAPEL